MMPVVYHPKYQSYWFGPQHPFSPVRQQMLLELLAALGHEPALETPPPATRDEILQVHSEPYVAQVEAASRGTPLPDAERFGLDTVDVPTFAGMDEAARTLVGGTLHAARLVADGRARRVLQLGGGLHHAHRSLASGFCVYNDLSVAIHALTAADLRVAYIDVDVHHGDGVQELHYDEHRVLTLSLHESGRYLFPGTGSVHELGEGGGRGLKLNVPLEPSTSDASYLDVFERVVPHALAWFGPDVLVVQCGADAHQADPLADLMLTTHAYEQLFRRLAALADQYAAGRAVFTLGGGYDFDASTRVWALLYLVLEDLPLPDRLPEAWLQRWEKRLNLSLTPTLHDPTPNVTDARSAGAALQNQQVSKRLLEMAAKTWH